MNTITSTTTTSTTGTAADAAPQDAVTTCACHVYDADLLTAP